jgi:hypothetical protein
MIPSRRFAIGSAVGQGLGVRAEEVLLRRIEEGERNLFPGLEFIDLVPQDESLKIQNTCLFCQYFRFTMAFL